MRGEFRFYQNGRLIAAHRNLITTAGKQIVLRRLSDQVGSLGGAIALGTGTTAAAVTDYRLNFEIDRVAIDAKVPDFVNYYILYKATIPQEAVYSIYEAGLWSEYNNAIADLASSRLLSTFNTTEETWTNMTADVTNMRTSPSGGRVDATASATTSARNTGISQDFSQYSGNDEFVVSFYKANNNIAGITLVFETTGTGGNYKSAEINAAALPVGYNTVAVKKSTFTATGTVDWANIDRLGVDVRASGTAGFITFDGLRIEDTDTINPSYTLVSHSILGSPIVKTAVAPMEIEYALDFAVT